MSKSHMLRALVNERLTVAAEEIFTLVERTIVELEEELCRYKEESARKQQDLYKVLNSHVLVQRVQVPTLSLEPNLQQEITEAFQLKEEKEEQNITQKEELLSEVPVTVCVKREEAQSSWVLQQRQTENIQETHAKDSGEASDLDPNGCVHIKTKEPTFGYSANYSDSTIYDDAGREPPENRSAMGDKDSTNIQITDLKTVALNFEDNEPDVPETTATVNDSPASETSGQDGCKKHECCICKKRFSRKRTLEEHKACHHGENSYSSSFCPEGFSNLTYLNVHKKTHIEKLPSCMICKKKMYYRNLKRHMATHTGDRPYSCTVCAKSFKQKTSVDTHMRAHTGEKPYSCTICTKKFTQKPSLVVHMRVHTGEKPYSCTVCTRSFTQKPSLVAHMRVHTGEKPYSCTVCAKAFRQSSGLHAHMKFHTSV